MPGKDPEGFPFNADHMINRMIPSKVSHQYQIEVRTLDGDSHIGFIAGFDDNMIQLYDVGCNAGLTSEDSVPDVRSLEIVGVGVNRWIPRSSVSSYNENFVGIKHYTPQAQAKIKARTEGIFKRSKEFVTE